MRQGRYPFIISMLVVPVVLYVVFVLSPYAQAFYISLTDWSGYTAAKTFVGMSNYSKLVHDSVFWTSVKHNLIAVVAIPLVTIALALFFATMLNVGGRRGRPRSRAFAARPSTRSSSSSRTSCRSRSSACCGPSSTTRPTTV